jgi:hypothetical protein
LGKKIINTKFIRIYITRLNLEQAYRKSNYIHRIRNLGRLGPKESSKEQFTETKKKYNEDNGEKIDKEKVKKGKQNEKPQEKPSAPRCNADPTSLSSFPASDPN